MGKNPAFQFYPKDYISDPQPQMASVSSRGIWMNFLCYMWESPTRGQITGTPEGVCRLARCTAPEFSLLITENARLNFADVTNCTPDVTIANRRRVKDKKIRTDVRLRKAKQRSHTTSHEKVTLHSPSTPSPSTPDTTKTSTKTLGAAVHKPALPAPDKATAWGGTMDEVRRFLVEIQAPDVFFVETYWLRIDQWLGGRDSGVAYFRELTAYLADQASKNGRSRGHHKDLLAGFRNWLAKSKFWSDQRAERRVIRERQGTLPSVS